jgi:hypothetical protein
VTGSARRLFVLATVLAWPAATLAQPAPGSSKEAGEHFRKAEAADKAARYADAISEYEAAYAIAPKPDVLFNIAVDQEKLGQLAEAADTFQRYLDERDTPASDADAVTVRIAELRAKQARLHPVRREPVKITPVEPAPTNEPPLGVVVAMPPTQPQPLLSGFTAWHVAGSYGIADGSQPSERYQLRGGRTFASRLDLDGVVGAFGNNDYALGAMLRFVIAPSLPAKPFLLAAATVGLAKQDASSRAGTRFPLGVEAGAGLQLGTHARLELDVVMRFLANGWGTDDTTAFSYANDAVAFGIDLGAAVDIPFISGGP